MTLLKAVPAISKAIKSIQFVAALARGVAGSFSVLTDLTVLTEFFFCLVRIICLVLFSVFQYYRKASEINNSGFSFL